MHQDLIKTFNNYHQTTQTRIFCNCGYSYSLVSTIFRNAISKSLCFKCVFTIQTDSSMSPGLGAMSTDVPELFRRLFFSILVANNVYIFLWWSNMWIVAWMRILGKDETLDLEIIQLERRRNVWCFMRWQDVHRSKFLIKITMLASMLKSFTCLIYHAS